MNNSIRLGISPCPNDTYIFEHWISSGQVQVTFADVQTLNEAARTANFDVIKVSAGVIPSLNMQEWEILPCGGALGYGCGPLLLTQANTAFSPHACTILPGKDTTAARLFHFWFKHQYPDQIPQVDYLAFDALYQALLKSEIAQGVVIHEHRFTWERDGLGCAVDLGAHWESQTQQPIPLGVILASRKLSEIARSQIVQEIRQSLDIAWKRTDPITPFIRKYAQETSEEVIRQHVQLFVTQASYDLGPAGLRALEVLFQGN